MRKIILSMVIICTLIIPLVFAQSVTVEMTHWIYPFLNRLESKGLMPGLKNGSLPFSREIIASHLDKLSQQLEENPPLLSNIEKQLFERARGEFVDEIANKSTVQKSEYEPHFYSWKPSQDHVYFDLLIGDDLTFQTYNSDDDDKSIQHGYYGGIIRGNWKGIGFYSNNQIHSEWGGGPYEQHYNASYGYPQSIQSDSSSIVWDVSVAYLSFGFKGLHFTFGRDRLQWGPSSFGNIMINHSIPPMDMFRISTQIGAASFTWFHGQLMSGNYSKWITAHRLEISASRTLDLGFNEVLIYGNRDIEPAYLNPVLPYLIAEHTLGDRDNLAIGLDFDYHGIRNLKLYGELFIDDLFAPWDVFSDFWGNRLAFLTGIHWIDPAGFDNSEMTIQYSRIEPYVYTHEDSVNIYEHFGNGIGSPLQPNSDGWTVQWQKWLHRNVQVELGGNITRHGDGDRKRPHLESDGDKKYFLTGTIEQKSSGYIKCVFQPKRDVFCHLILGRKSFRNVSLVQNNDRNIWEVDMGMHINW